MRVYFCDNLIAHYKRRVYRFFQFMRDKKTPCFLGIKRNKPSFCPSHNFFKIQIKKFSAVSGFSTIINKLVSSAKRGIFDLISVTMSLIKSRKRNGTKDKTLRNTSSYNFPTTYMLILNDTFIPSQIRSHPKKSFQFNCSLKSITSELSLCDISLTFPRL